MNHANSKYPGYLNPFGEDDEDGNEPNSHEQSRKEYPEYLSPFGEESNDTGDDYDNSLNPFGPEDECSNESKSVTIVTINSDDVKTIGGHASHNNDASEKNLFDEVDSDNEEPREKREVANTVPQTTALHYTDTSEPPKPLPRTKSLLKKEQALKKTQEERANMVNSKINTLLSATSNTSPSSITTNCTTISTTNSSFQKKKNKRNAPPVPVNFKRQVTGSLDAIEAELNDIGDQLSAIEKESVTCQDILTRPAEADDPSFSTAKSKYIDLIKRKHSISRRQKELMYKKRELHLDQIHSDIEYELRMIGNKQKSHRTSDDEAKEQELLKKLVEIVEEKNDIVENLSKDTFCDYQFIEEALKRLNISTGIADDTLSVSSENITKAPPGERKEPCDKGGLAKLSKIATLIPKTATLKNTMKIKRKKLFKKKCDSSPIEH